MFGRCIISIDTTDRKWVRYSFMHTLDANAVLKQGRTVCDEGKKQVQDTGTNAGRIQCIVE